MATIWIEMQPLDFLQAYNTYEVCEILDLVQRVCFAPHIEIDR